MVFAAGRMSGCSGQYARDAVPHTGVMPPARDGYGVSIIAIGFNVDKVKRPEMSYVKLAVLARVRPVLQGWFRLVSVDGRTGSVFRMRPDN
jgi:hypothetical protein